MLQEVKPACIPKNSPGEIWMLSTALPCLASRSKNKATGHMSLVLADCWNNLCETSTSSLPGEGQPKSELICGYNTISHPGGWAHCKLCYIISLRMTGGEIWAPVVLFHWYHLIAQVGPRQPTCLSCPALRLHIGAIRMWALYIGQVHVSETVSGALSSPGLPSSMRQSLSHSIHH